MKTFKYLGSTLAEDGELDAKVTNRVKRVEEREECRVLWDRKINKTIKRKGVKDSGNTGVTGQE